MARSDIDIDFVTSGRWSAAYCSTSARPATNCEFTAEVSCRARLHNRANDALRTNSRPSRAQGSSLDQACGALSNSEKQTVSHSAQLSKSAHQRSICSSVTSSGSSTSAATMRAS